MEKDEKGLTVKKEENFSEWYTQLIQKADLAEYTSVSGCIVFKPTAWAMWEKIRDAVDKEIKKMGVKNVCFPLFIPEKLLTKESQHVEGFAPEVAWVTHAGDTELSERLAVRPTSEAIMYDSYSKWIRSWRDLPLKCNQWSNVVRWEFKHAIPFFRTREFMFNEGHTVFATKKESDAEGPKILNMYMKILNNLMAIPGFVGRKTEKEKFAGADYSVSIECYLPNGKAIQGPIFHNDGQNFAKAYDIKFLNQDEKEEYAWQNTWAISTRMLGVMISLHSDNYGLVIPPNIAQDKVVIVPILIKGQEEKILKKAKELHTKIKDSILDDRDYYSPGWKYNEWELKGIPIRIEIGPKDIENKSVMLYRRDTRKKEAVKLTNLDETIKSTLKDIQDNLYKKAEKLLKDNIQEVKTFDEFKKGINDKKIVLAPFCDVTECEEEIKSRFEGVKALNKSLDKKPSKGTKCVQCGKEAKVLCHFGKSY